jgi:hypothetical protein
MSSSKLSFCCEAVALIAAYKGSMTIGWAQEREIENDKQADNHCSEQEPFLFCHAILSDALVLL